MTRDEVLVLLKQDLGYVSVSDGMQGYLGHLVETAQMRIAKEGITLQEPFTADDGNLIEMYAAYLFRRRNDPGPMPRMLRYALNNRLFAEKAGEQNAT